MRQLHNTYIIIEFVLRAISTVWQEPKTSVKWERQGKQLSLSVSIFNHLLNDEIKEGETSRES